MYINAVSHYLPNTLVTNEYYFKISGLTDEWIYQRSGIKKRTRAGSDENTNTMGIRAVEGLINNIPFSLNEIDLIIGATYTPYDTLGTLAHSVQSHFNIAGAKAFTISTACSSFINAIEITEGFFATGKASKVLIVASEHNSAYNDDKDTQSGYLWGDGAAAIILTEERHSEYDFEIIDIHSAALANVGKGTEGIFLRPNEGGLRMPFGKDVFMYASKYMVYEVEDILKKNNYSIEDIKYVIPHQANMRIINNASENLKLKEEQLLCNIEQIGNTGCASTPIILSQNMDKFKKDDLIVFTVFGGGYSCGAMLIKKR